eukprot:TRINITY_DN53091_c0_g1_i1.p1 TRINITY_DN53091_c0_g1~~TRINITY_DN53091_c0_g1_i1.p1  ORF type:complete len:310 (+),score=58.11 TRINITY_DN53091_c0_g1_i1:121-1050(+)
MQSTRFLFVLVITFSHQLLATTSQVSLEVYYGLRCPNCLQELRYSLLPLLESGIQGDEVKITFLPWPHSGEASIAVEHSCALRSDTVDTRADSSALLSAVKFVACDLNLLTNPNAPERTRETAMDCAKKAAVPWDGPKGLEACAEGGPESQGYAFMTSKLYTSTTDDASSRLHGAAVTPYMFLNGQLLHCNGPGSCDAVYTSKGLQKLSKPGNLMDIVCSMLSSPAPEACSSTRPEKVGAHFGQACENCDEVVDFSWKAHAHARARSPWQVASLFAGLVCGSLAGLSFSFWGWSRCKRSSADGLMACQE